MYSFLIRTHKDQLLVDFQPCNYSNNAESSLSKFHNFYHFASPLRVSSSTFYTGIQPHALRVVDGGALLDFLGILLAWLEGLEDGNSDIYRPENGGHDDIGVHHGTSVVGQLETKTTVDDTQNHNGTSVPDVSMANTSASLMLAVHLMMVPSEQGLDA